MSLIFFFNSDVFRLAQPKFTYSESVQSQQINAYSKSTMEALGEVVKHFQN